MKSNNHIVNKIGNDELRKWLQHACTQDDLNRMCRILRVNGYLVFAPNKRKGK